jgi:hypothetical protein
VSFLFSLTREFGTPLAEIVFTLKKKGINMMVEFAQEYPPAPTIRLHFPFSRTGRFSIHFPILVQFYG